MDKGELVGLIGLNGAGKSTTIKHIIGLMNPHSGEIRVNGVTFSEDPEKYRKSFTYIPETPILYEELTLREHLELTAMAYGLDQDVFEARSAALLKRVYDGETIEMVSISFFERDAAKSNDYVCISRESIALYY